MGIHSYASASLSKALNKENILELDTGNIFHSYVLDYPDLSDLELSHEHLSKLLDSLKTIRLSNSPDIQIKLLIYIADKLRESGNYKEGLSYSYEALQLADSLKLFREKNATLQGLSNIFYELYLHIDKEDFLDSTEFYSYLVYKNINEITDSSLISENYNVLGAIQIHRNNPDSALSLLYNALDHYHSDIPPLPILANLSFAYYLQNNYKQAFSKINKCYNLSIASGNIVFEGICLDNMYLYYIHLGDSLRASQMREKRIQLSNNHKVELRKILEKNLILKTENDEIRYDFIQLKSVKYYLVKLNRLLFVVLSVSIVLIIFIFFLWIQSKKLRRMNQKLIHSLKISNQLNLDKKELEIKNKESEKRRLKAELNVKQVALNSKLIAQTNFRELFLRIEQLISSGLTESNSSKRNKLLMEAKQIIKVNQKTDLWEEYHQLFNAASGTFIKKLEKIHRGLSINEKRLAYLIVAGLSSKEIAQILHKTYRSVEMARHRLRQKLELDSSTNIYTYLQSFSE